MYHELLDHVTLEIVLGPPLLILVSCTLVHTQLCAFVSFRLRLALACELVTCERLTK